MGSLIHPDMGTYPKGLFSWHLSAALIHSALRRRGGNAARDDPEQVSIEVGGLGRP